MTTSIYQEYGWDDRMDYLNGLAEEYDLPLSKVLAVANVLGEAEDFDALLIHLEEIWERENEEM